MANKPFTVGERTRIIAAWNAGATTAALAMEFGRDRTTIASMLSYWRRRCGLQVRRERLDPVEAKAKRDQVADMWRDGAAAPDIAAALQVPRAVIYEWLQRLRDEGVDLPRRRRASRGAA